MTTTELSRTSAYPPSVDRLVPTARELAARLGAVPSRNRLMRELRIGANKAAAVLARLTADTPNLTPTPIRAATPPALSVVPTPRVEPAEPAPSDQPEPTSPAAADRPTAPVTTLSTGAVRSATRPVRSWPVVLLALPAFVAIWSGWVGLGGLTGFGVVHPLPGIWDGLALNTAITLPIGMETYAAFALRAWLSHGVPVRARRFAKWSAIGALALGAAGQVAYHLMTAAGVEAAPWPITTVVACLPVAVLGMGAALAHLLHEAAESAIESGEVSR
jgi:hypothetical protein